MPQLRNVSQGYEGIFTFNPGYDSRTCLLMIADPSTGSRSSVFLHSTVRSHLGDSERQTL